jgi:mono/diheme cytochrome c family protein
VSEPEPDPNDKYAAAKTIFRAQCAKCHSTAAPGEGKMRGGRAPNLAKIGADPKHTKAWISEHIRDPQSHNEMSKMPKFEGKLKGPELQALVDYLASLK